MCDTRHNNSLGGGGGGGGSDNIKVRRCSLTVCNNVPRSFSVRLVIAVL